MKSTSTASSRATPNLSNTKATSTRADKFAADLALSLYDQMLRNHQPLPAALRLGMQETTAGDRARFVPSLSVATPILFGPRAATATLIPPQRMPDFILPSNGLSHFPPEPERFVGRLMPMLRAGQALAPGSPQRGVLFHGMASGGKTACALELAYRYLPQTGGHQRFQGFVFHKCPDEGADVATSLGRPDASQSTTGPRQDNKWHQRLAGPCAIETATLPTVTDGSHAHPVAARARRRNCTAVRRRIDNQRPPSTAFHKFLD